MPQDSIVVNPFQLVFDALWSMLENSPVFIADVKEGNRIHYNLNNDRNPGKPNINDSDLPEVILIPSGMEPNLGNTSSTSKVIRTYTWIVSTGDMRVNNWLHQIEWDILCGMTGWTSILGALEWPVSSGKNFAKRFDAKSATQGIANADANRSVPGWSSVWACEVEMHFQTSDLVSYRGY